MTDDRGMEKPAGGDGPAPSDEGADELVELTSVQGEIEASVIRSLLEESGVLSLAKSELVQSIWPLSVDGLGKVTIWVRRADRERALRIIAKHKEGK